MLREILAALKEKYPDMEEWGVIESNSAFAEVDVSGGSILRIMEVFSPPNRISASIFRKQAHRYIGRSANMSKSSKISSKMSTLKKILDNTRETRLKLEAESRKYKALCSQRNEEINTMAASIGIINSVLRQSENFWILATNLGPQSIITVASDKGTIELKGLTIDKMGKILMAIDKVAREAE